MTQIDVHATTTPIQLVGRGPRGRAGPAIELRDNDGVLEWRVQKANPDPWAALVDLGQFLSDSDAAAVLARAWASEDEDVVVDDGLYSALHHALKAQASAASASSSAGTASGANTAAESARDITSGYAASAGDSAETATEQAGISTSAAGAAAQARDKAKEWAEANEDSEVETGQYSAKHHALKAAASAEAAATFDPVNFYSKTEMDASLSGKSDTSHTHSAATTSAAGFMSAADKTKLNAVEASADVTDAANVGSSIHGATAKTTPVDADTVPLIDSAASNILKKLTWANVKATLKTYFDTLYQATNAKLTTLAGQTWAADRFTYYTSASAAAIGTITTFGRSLIDDADAAAARTTLGLGSLATLSAVNNANWSGTALSIANGGTGQATAANAFNALKQSATQTATGVVELATDAEMTAGTATGVIPNVKQVADYVAANSSGGIYSIGSVVSLSNDAAASFTLSTTAEEIEFRLQNVIPVGDTTAQLLMFGSTNNGASYDVPLRALWVSRSSSTSGSNVSSTTIGLNFDLGGVGSDINEYGVTMEMKATRRAGNYQIFTFAISSIDGSGAMTFRAGSIEAQTTALLTNIRFQFHNTNLESGRIIVINLEAA
jgi:hypothetical protein